MTPVLQVDGDGTQAGTESGTEAVDGTGTVSPDTGMTGTGGSMTDETTTDGSDPP